jgi:hypothetical protein
MSWKNGPEGRNDASDTNDKTRQQEIQRAREEAMRVFRNSLGDGLAWLLPSKTDEMHRRVRIAPSTPSYTWDKRRLQQDNGSMWLKAGIDKRQNDFRKGVVERTVKWSWYEAPNTAAEMDWAHSWERVVMNKSNASDFDGLKGLPSFVNTSNSTIRSDIWLNGSEERFWRPTSEKWASLYSEWIPDNWSVSRGFNNGAWSPWTDAEKFTLHAQVQQIHPQTVDQPING